MKHKIDFTNWHTINDFPEEMRDFLISDGKLMNYICFILKSSTGYMETSYGSTYWNDFVKNSNLKYWIYLDEIQVKKK